MDTAEKKPDEPELEEKQILEEILKLVKPKETVAKTLQRLGGQNQEKLPAWKQKRLDALKRLRSEICIHYNLSNLLFFGTLLLVKSVEIWSYSFPIKNFFDLKLGVKVKKRHLLKPRLEQTKKISKN